MSHQIVQCDAIAAIYPRPAALTYIDPPFNTGSTRSTTTTTATYTDTYGSIEDYIDWLIPRIDNLRHMTHGNFIVHVDPRTSHYLKIELDRIFGRTAFQNEIIWKYNSGGAGKRKLAAKHDTLLWYTTKKDYTFNIQRERYATPNVAHRAGFHPGGRMLTDVWDISIISTTGRERVGYPTQKPLALLDRIVRMFSNPGDLVADGFCGSGTTGVAAITNQRDFYGCDVNQTAVEITAGRTGLVADTTRQY
jgi:site-specific DNA-methyltransferase (adenine-specific)